MNPPNPATANVAGAAPAAAADLLAVITTVATEAEADTLARGAVQARLAACVQVEAVRSTYRWQGQLCQDAEQRLLFKTTQAAAPRLLAWLRAQHPYTLPALYALPVAEATADYAAWVQAEVAELAEGATP